MSAAGQAALSTFKAKYTDHNFSQSGQAGAVPAPDTAPLTGGAHESPETAIKDVALQYVNDRTAPLFNQHTGGSLSDVANGNVTETGHGSTGESYDNKNR